MTGTATVKPAPPAIRFGIGQLADWELRDLGTEEAAAELAGRRRFRARITGSRPRPDTQSTLAP
jgi:hypothetical protein